MRSALKLSTVVGLLVGASACFQVQDRECSVDRDCVGGRICEDGKCTDPEDTGSGGSSSAGKGGTEATGATGGTEGSSGGTGGSSGGTEGSSGGSGNVSGGAGTGGQVDSCAAPQCTAGYCDWMRTWCTWTVRVNFYDEAAGMRSTCSECVYDQVATVEEDPKDRWCGNLYYCYSRCVEDHESEGVNPVWDCADVCFDDYFEACTGGAP
jgi:hypothetical protein